MRSASTATSRTRASTLALRSRPRSPSSARWRCRGRSRSGSPTTASTTRSRTSPATRTRRTSATGRASRQASAASSTRTSAGSSRSRGWSAAASTDEDLYEDRLVRTIDRLYLLWVILTLGIPFAVGFLVGGSVARGLEAMVWAGLLRIFLYQHATFSVNSICHMFGRKDYSSRDEARNNWVDRGARPWRGLAQQPPRVPELGPARAAPLADRRVMVGHPRAREARARLERQTADVGADGAAPDSALRGLKPLELVRDELRPAAGVRERQRCAPGSADRDRVHGACDQLVGALDAARTGPLEASE